MCLEKRIGIIGAGPAGVSAAVQLCRCDLSVILFEKGLAGGLVRNAWRVDNLPVLPMIGGPVLAERLAERVERSGASIVGETVLRVDFDGLRDCFEVLTSEGTYSVHTLVVASGTRPTCWPILEEMDPQLRPFVHREIVGLHAEGRVWAVVGSGDAAYDYALSLCDAGGRVVLLQRGERGKALSLLQGELLNRADKIKRLVTAELTAVRFGTKRPLLLEIQQPGERQSLEADGLIGAIGRVPADGFLSQRVVEKSDSLMKSGRFYRIGDVNGSPNRQVAIAMGEGLNAAMDIVSVFEREQE